MKIIYLGLIASLALNILSSKRIDQLANEIDILAQNQTGMIMVIIANHEKK